LHIQIKSTAIHKALQFTILTTSGDMYKSRSYSLMQYPKLLSLRPFYVQIFSSALYFRTYVINFLPPK